MSVSVSGQQDAKVIVKRLHQDQQWEPLVLIQEQPRLLVNVETPKLLAVVEGTDKQVKRLLVSHLSLETWSLSLKASSLVGMTR